MNLLSKTDYMVWRDCPHNAWMKKWKPDIYYALPPSEFDKSLITSGNQVEEKAREFFGEGMLIEGRDEESLKRTKELLQNKVSMLFQACFSDGTLFAAVDILKKGNSGELSIYEVKASSTSKMEEDYGEEEESDADTMVDFKDVNAVAKYKKKLLKDPHLFDLAFQVYIVRKTGYKVAEAYLVRLNKSYMRGETLDLKRLFVKEEVLWFVDEILSDVEKEIEVMIENLNSPKKLIGHCCCIDKGRSKHCTTFCEHNSEVPSYSVHDISRIGTSKAKLHELIDSGIYDILNIPDGFVLSPKMQKQVMVHKRGKAEINHLSIKEELETLQFPLYFLDYESFNPAIPRFKGYKPYQQIPFQYSLHILDSIDSELKHEEFFYAGQDDPSPMFVADLKNKIGTSGSVIVWNRTFEESHINKHLAIRLPEYAEFINNVNSRIFDLMKIFSKQLHIHPDFHGSASIKKVLPVLCPELSYKELDIGNGSEAMNTWNRLVTEEVEDNEKVKIEKAMLEYCGLDTYAMYAIWKHLKDLV